MSDKRALVIDDDHANRSIWELVLGENGYEVATADTLSAGMGYVGEDVSLYLVDYHLPDGSGIDLVSYIRANYPISMIVIVSVDDDNEVIRECIRAGGNVFMVKPTSPAVMSQVLAEIEAGALDYNAKQLINRNGRRTYSD
jgi:CheY-like chemotaxis protein